MTAADPLVVRAAARSTATLHEAGGKIGALPSAIRVEASGITLTGRAFPVLSPGGDNLWLHHAIYAASPGDVLVIATGDREFGYWGEARAVAAQARGLAGLVIDGGVRDVARMRDLGFPVFSSAICIRGTDKDIDGVGKLGLPITIGDVVVRAGDIVRGDDDGVVVLPAADAETIIAVGEQRDADEGEIFRRLRAGGTTAEIYGLPRPKRMTR